jgi:hypothetical protein
VLGDDDHNEGLVRIFQGIGRFEDAADDGRYPGWGSGAAWYSGSF